MATGLYISYVDSMSLSILSNVANLPEKPVKGGTSSRNQVSSTAALYWERCLAHDGATVTVSCHVTAADICVQAGSFCSFLHIHQRLHTSFNPIGCKSIVEQSSRTATHSALQGMSRRLSDLGMPLPHASLNCTRPSPDAFRCMHVDQCTEL